MKVWGCLAKVEIPKPKQVKIGPKIIDCIFIRYTNNSSAYRFLVHKSKIQDVHEWTIIESRNASFFKNVFPCKDNENASSNKRTYNPTSGTSNEKELTRSKRARISTSFDPDFYPIWLKMTQRLSMNQYLLRSTALERSYQ